MKIVKRRAVALAAMVAALIGLLALAPSASAYPGNTGGVSVTTTTPTAGGSLGVSGSSCLPNSMVTIALDGSTVLGTAATGSDGTYSATVQLPSGVTGSHTIVISGAQCAAVAGINILAGGGGTTTGGGGGLAGTGVAVIGIGALGVVLLIGGGLMLLAGRRRNKVVA